jgi:hypothetical protein
MRFKSVSAGHALRENGITDLATHQLALKAAEEGIYDTPYTQPSRHKLCSSALMLAILTNDVDVQCNLIPEGFDPEARC